MILPVLCDYLDVNPNLSKKTNSFLRREETIDIEDLKKEKKQLFEIYIRMRLLGGPMVKLVDTRDLKSLGASCTGSSPVRATKSPSSPHHKFSSLTIFVGVAQPFGSSRESLNVIGLCIFLKLLGNANHLQLPAPFQKDHSPNLFLSEFRGFFSLSQQNRYNRQK